MSCHHQLPDGTTIPLPKVVTAQIGKDSNKYTVCIYGHVDVQPAKKEDGWATDPYNLTDINGQHELNSFNLLFESVLILVALYLLQHLNS